MQYIDVVFPELDGVFTYSIEESISSLLGKIVICPFKSGNKIGVVFDIVNTKPEFKVRGCAIHENFQNFQFSKQTLNLIRWISEFYFSNLANTLKLFLPSWILGAKTLKIESVTSEKTKPNTHKLYDLKPDQVNTLTTIQNSFTENRNILLWGITGSGKTEIYRHLTLDQTQKNKQVLILVPEILLTKQVSKQFEEIYGKDVSIWSSDISISKKKKIWVDVSQGKTQVVIGTRSSLFLPFTNLGLIIMDEEHEWDSYKNEQDPRYHAKRIALKMSEIYTANLLLGTATPSLESYYLYKMKLIDMVKLDKKVWE